MAAETTTTMAEQIEAAKLVSKIMGDANALSMKLKCQLEEARTVFEKLRDYQHPKLEIPTRHERWAGDKDALSPARIIEIEISRINAVLGDRA